MTHQSPTHFRFLAALPLAAAAFLPGCHSDYAADIRNHTSQPIYAQMNERFDDGTVVPKAAIRLGPGDRGACGPINAQTGRVTLLIDNRPNPRPPYIVELRPGVSIFEITEDVNSKGSPMIVRDVTP